MTNQKKKIRKVPSEILKNLTSHKKMGLYSRRSMGDSDKAETLDKSSPFRRSQVIDFSNTLTSKQYSNQTRFISNFRGKDNKNIVLSLQKEIEEYKKREEKYIHKINQ